MTDKVETLRWRDGALEMIDQRVLPERLQYQRYKSAAEVAQGIHDMVVRGAPAIGCAAAYGIALEARRVRDAGKPEFQVALSQAFTVLTTSRPTAVNLAWALARMRKMWESVAGESNASVAERLLAEANNILREDLAINRALGRHGAELIADGARVMTHCNAGALATAGYGTALGVIRSAVEAGKKLSVLANETRPFLQGARLTAWELIQEGIPVTLVADSAAAHLMARGRVDSVIVGADRVAGNGDVANKIGTYMLAVVARHHGIPFYVACPLSTIDLKLASGAEIPIEERAGAELEGFGNARWAPRGVQAHNPVFDVTPRELITGIITEKGVVRGPNAEKLKALFQD
jgi:methylthioribose-1-phosphate isomerase